jgi:hypothetical protein
MLVDTGVRFCLQPLGIHEKVAREKRGINKHVTSGGVVHAPFAK